MEYSRRPTKSIPKENQLKILNKIYQTYLVSTTEWRRIRKVETTTKKKHGNMFKVEFVKQKTIRTYDFPRRATRLNHLTLCCTCRIEIDQI